MDTMRREVIWTGGLLLCVLAVNIGAQVADSAPIKAESDSSENVDILVSEIRADQLIRLPETYKVKKRYPDGHAMNNALAGAPLGCAGLDVETKEIYTSKGGQFAYPPGRGRRVADDLVTELFRACSICSLEVRVTGGVANGDGEFRADISLFDGCPSAGGSEIPGSLVKYTGLEDDLGQFHDLVLDYSDRGVCSDAGTCVLDGSLCHVMEQDCAVGGCTNGFPCDPDQSFGTCDDKDGTACDQACEDGSQCTNSTCADNTACVPACAGGFECFSNGPACGDGSECVRSECIGPSCLLSQQNCTGGTCDDGSACNTDGPACGDGSTCVSSFIACVEDPLQIPAAVWLRLRFDTDDAAVVLGTPPTRGFSADGYDDPQGPCTAWFAGWPAFPHASFYSEIIAPADCETHFLAYLAANPHKPAFLPSDLGPVIGPGGVLRPPVTHPETRLGDDITLTVDNCILSAYELGIKGTFPPEFFVMDIDLRWPDVQTIQQGTRREFYAWSGDNTVVGHFTIDEDLNLAISANDQPIFITWQSNNATVGAIEVDINQAGTSGPTMLAYDVDPARPDEWVVASDGDNTPAVFYAAIFCRGETSRGACCPDQFDTPGSEMNCFDDVPVTSCLGNRWLANTTCDENLFDPPCGTHACCMADGSCDNVVREDCLMTCDTSSPPIECQTDQDCPGERTCGTDVAADLCTSVCATWDTGSFCDDADFECPQPCEIGDVTTIFFADSLEIDPPGPPILDCSIDARQPHELYDAGLALGWDRMVMQLACNAATLSWSRLDFQVTSTSGNIENQPKSIVYDDTRARLSVVLYHPIAPGEWTCIEHLDSGQRWCAGSLPGDADQNRLVTTGDITALINAINLSATSQAPLYATDINRSGITAGVDILRLIDLLNGAADFDPWITRSLPPCPSG
ncbi:MAG: hypothetical protein IIA00_05735 [Proteobacteria bacterium]|nr:hypothetical protein [Pseudomonadota bacterium]